MANPSLVPRAKIGECLGSFPPRNAYLALQADIPRQMIEDGENPDEEVFGLVAKLQHWEQNRVPMEPATIALMRILAREPEAALRSLRPRDA